MTIPHAITDNGPADRNFRALDVAVEGLTGAVSVTGARDDPEEALANLLTVLAGLGIITDDTTAT